MAVTAAIRTLAFSVLSAAFCLGTANSKAGQDVFEPTHKRQSSSQVRTTGTQAGDPSSTDFKTVQDPAGATAGGDNSSQSQAGAQGGDGFTNNSGSGQQQKPVNAIPAGYTGKPYRSLIHIIPGVIQAEHYDVPSQIENGITFNSHGKPQAGPYRISGDCLEIERFGNGHKSIAGRKEPADQVYVAAKSAGEWWKYTVQVKETATYLMAGHFAVQDEGTEISVSFGSEIGSGPVRVPKTAGKLSNTDWQHSWEMTETLTEVTLPAGLYVMTVKVDRGAGLNFDYLTFIRKSNGARGAPKDSDLSNAFNQGVRASNQGPLPPAPNPNPPSL